MIFSRFSRFSHWNRSVPILFLAVLSLAQVLTAGPSAESIGRAVTETVSSSLYKDVIVSIVVTKVGTESPLYQREPDVRHAPASVIKMLPSAVALDRMGPDYRFRTAVIASAAPADGILKGDLVIQGSGDPSFSTARLSALVDRLYESGLRSIEGSVVYDDSVFDTEESRYGDNARHLYAPPSGLNLDANRIDISILSEDPAKLALSPATANAYASLSYEVSISKSGNPGRPSMIVTRLESGDRYRIKGTITAWDRRYNYLALGVTRPGLYCASVLKSLLVKRGISITGGVKQGTAPPNGTLLAEDRSPPLSTILAEMNRESNNVSAESLNKAIAVAAGHRPGTRAKGIEVIRGYLAKEGGLAAGSFRLEDSSGLSPQNSFSAEQIVSLLLRWYANRTIRKDFMDSLAVQGKHPHASNPVPPEHLLVQVKTGTLSARGVNSVAGYITDKRTDEVYAFAIFASRKAPGPLTYSGTLTNPLLKALLSSF